jgi:hypothetical protein
MTKCTACGYGNQDSVGMCGACGNNLRAASAAPLGASPSGASGPSGAADEALDEIARQQQNPGLFPSEVTELYRSGRRLAAHHALSAAARAQPAQGQRWSVWLDDLRLWAEPGRSPSMFTFNGMGTMLYGKYQLHSDNTRIATLYFVFAFLPLFPIESYLVSPAPTKGWRSSWYFLGQTPMAPGARKVRWVIPAGLAMIAAYAVLVGLSVVD